MSGAGGIDYLKVKATYGISDNGNLDNYFLYNGTFVRGATLDYYNGTNRNSETNYASVANDIGLQKRRDFTAGIEGAFLNKALQVDAGYFNSTSLDNITLMRSEEHTSELQSLMRISYAVFCLKKKKKHIKMKL